MNKTPHLKRWMFALKQQLNLAGVSLAQSQEPRMSPIQNPGGQQGWMLPHPWPGALAADSMSSPRSHKSPFTSMVDTALLIIWDQEGWQVIEALTAPRRNSWQKHRRWRPWGKIEHTGSPLQKLMPGCYPDVLRFLCNLAHSWEQWAQPRPTEVTNLLLLESRAALLCPLHDMCLTGDRV
jgi:hypothetical protein